MLDFLSIEVTPDPRARKSRFNVSPVFIYGKHKDLMVRGGSFYGVWDEKYQRWNTNIYDLITMVDEEIQKKCNEIRDLDSSKTLIPMFLSRNDSRKFRDFLEYCKNSPDNYHLLNQKIIFSNEDMTREDYVTKKLDYPIEDIPINNYEELMNVLYNPSEKEKLEWLIGSIICGKSKFIQKFFVLYGESGTGKSTFINIVQDMFPGLYSSFDSKALGSSNSQFALEAFTNDPLIAIQHDGDFSRVEDNTRLNSLVAHEELLINEKHKKQYTKRFNGVLLVGTNKPVKITDAKSGLLRRLIDVSPTGNKIPVDRYNEIISSIKFELGGIAHHCKEVFEELGESYYNNYKPKIMMSITNDFYNFVDDNFEFFMENQQEIKMSSAWLRYKEYCLDAGVKYPLNKRFFKEEMKLYFNEFKERTNYARNVYRGFKEDMINYKFKATTSDYIPEWLTLKDQESIFDKECSDCIAQYATLDETPKQKWEKVTTKLSDLDTSIVHYVQPPGNHIVIDFDIKNEEGEKDLQLNIEAAMKFPHTYAEVSKGGQGLHLHYIYNGDIEKLAGLYDKDIEVKVYKGNSALRRKLSLCNNQAISVINSGLPLKGEKKRMVRDETIQNERHLRNLILKNLKKEIWPNTKPSVDYIYKLLDDAYNSGIVYDVEDMFPAIQAFANNSTNQSEQCLQLVSKMKFKSETENENVEDFDDDDDEIIFFDIEVFPNLLLLVYKRQGPNHEPVTLFNPTPDEIDALHKKKLVGFNNRKYDNHILYARMMGYNNDAIFQLSQDIVVTKREGVLFREAYNFSYTDIYDFLSAANKMSLKKWEIELDIHHQELGFPWDQPLDEDKWLTAAEYCINDVLATEAVWDANQGDWEARKMLAALSGLTVNDTTNSHTKRIILGRDRNVQDQFIYTDLSTIFPGYQFNKFGFDKNKYGQDAKIVKRKSYYMGEDPGEGGYVYANPGIWENVTVQDAVSMHPNSIKALCLFGPKYTKRFYELVEARVAIKKGNYILAGELLDGKLKPFLTDETKAKTIADALKTAINSVYGLTAATFPNDLKDPRNIDNIVAKYGALFMITLKNAVQEQGFTVAHIKTDSIKIVNPTKDILDFVVEFGKKYGFEFTHEATYSKFCLVNESTYIAKVVEENGKPVDPYWTATGKEFQVPYIFKTLFSHEPIKFRDLCETKSATTALYLNMVDHPDDEPNYHFVGKVGSFIPILPGHGGGILLRQDDKIPGRYTAVEGTKKPGKIPKDEIGVYFWMESEQVKLLEKQDSIDMSYWDTKVQLAKESISKYGDFDEFVSDSPMSGGLPWTTIDDDREVVPYDDYILKAS